MSFIDVNLFLLIVEMMMFTKEKLPIKEKISNENAELRSKLISIFYDHYRTDLLDSRKFNSSNQYMLLSDLDYLLNHVQMSDEYCREIRSRIDQSNFNILFDVNFFLFKLSLESSLHAYKDQKTETLFELKDKAIRSSRFRSVYEVMRYLD